ncbi:MAG: hypothetical protein AMXMBFR33_66790 [Candidatus Xenobia bacterium]
MQRRGAALATVLGLVVLLLFVCVTVAALSITNLNFSRSFREAVQAELLARSAIAQFIADCEADPVGSGLDPSSPPPLAGRYPGGNIFPDGGTRLGGTAEVTFDLTRPFHSVDNSQNELPAQGWSDRGTTRRSVPAFGVSLVMKISTGRKTTYYEAMLRRRWPFVLASHSPIGFLGGAAGSGRSSLVTGDLLVYPKHDEPPLPDPMPLTTVGIPIDLELYQRIKNYNSAPKAGVVAVGSMSLPGPWNLTQGNRYEGQANFVAGQWSGGMAPIVHANPGNTAIPSPRADRYNVNGYLPPLPGDPPGTQRSILDTIMTVPGAGGDDLVSIVPPNTLKELPVGSFGKYYLLERDIWLVDRPESLPTPMPPTPAGPPEVIFGTDFQLTGALGNRYLGASGVEATGASIKLINSTLHVVGNLDLCQFETSGGTTIAPSLEGSNATLIVEGNLLLDDGALDAVNRGMVIYAQSAVVKAKGNYRGLIMIRDGAVFYPGDGGALTIQGGLVTGARRAFFSLYQPPATPGGPPPPPDPNYPPFAVSGLNLFATVLTYKPAYLKSINAFGKYEPMLLRKLL